MIEPTLPSGLMAQTAQDWGRGPILPYSQEGSAQTYRPSLTPSVSSLVSWLTSLHRASVPVPPLPTSLLDLYRYVTSGNQSTNPDTTANSKYTSYVI